MTRTVLYPGSFDPLTNGHVDILRKSLALADRVIVAIGVQASKTPTFSFDERVEMIETVAREAFGAEAAGRLVVAVNLDRFGDGHNGHRRRTSRYSGLQGYGSTELLEYNAL